MSAAIDMRVIDSQANYCIIWLLRRKMLWATFSCTN